MLKLLAAALITSAAMIGTIRFADADPVTITFRFNDTEQEVRGAIDAFEKQNPNIKVDLQRIGWKDARNQFLREAAVGQGPDVAHVAQVWVTEMGDAGATLALDDLIRKDPPPNGFADFAAQDLAKGKDGHIYGLPWTTDTWAMVYRTDLLKEAGIESLPTTWEDIRKDSEAVYKKTGKTGFGFPAGSSASGAMWFLANFYWWSHGKELIVQKPDGSYAIGLTLEDVTESMNYYKKFMDEGDNPRPNLAASDAHDPAIMQALITGNQAMGAMPPNTFKEALKAYEDANPGKPAPFASGPFPHQNNTKSSMIGGRMLVINANSKHPDAAWKFVKFMASQSVFADYYRTQFPAQTSLLKQIDFGAPLKGFADQFPYARTWGAYASGPVPIGTLWNVTQRAFGKALSGQQSTENAAKELLAEIGKQMP
ncbi:sugar ABC transporter substrate-binding protein [Bradyrhizobium manausense]|jgi:multiple sugar transport system substrate-binding protein|uniref:ABC transporter substrate-binding protein n=1 Tax=Bradyrhizobium manausense TaxID=989370 RepID=UPI001BAAEFA0|nr:sugar ABC transporter substrate-binding protein [Bradyrhizobium manausense]MBR0787789.1 sugar ABC transporter substrate-binding protein [Bradyrhizobium manausense]